MPPFTLTLQQLVFDLREAYFRASRHKMKTQAVAAFAQNLDSNIVSLANDLFNRRYHPRPSTCFIISDPKKREVFAADFADRVVHHLYFAYAAPIFERTFIADSYSCICGRGTHYGIARLSSHISSESLNYTRPAFALKLDIRGYFMHISRALLADIAMATLRRMAAHRIHHGLAYTWADCVDIDFLCYLTREIAMSDPTVGCIRRGRQSDWAGLPDSKSLFHSPEGCGLPIGNLTSQLFSNVYLGQFDDFMKREVRCRHYGRYVDDAYVVSSDRQWLMSLIPVVREWLLEHLGLELHMGKTRVVDVRQGVEFLGAFVKPGRTYVANGTLSRIGRHLADLDEAVATGEMNPDRLRCALSSYGGVLGHFASFNIRKALFLAIPDVCGAGEWDADLLRFTPSSTPKSRAWLTGS